MNIVNSGDKYNIYGSSIQTFSKLPAITYRVCFNENEGFYLLRNSDLDVGEKIYGSCQAKVDKTLKSFNAMSRNMGIILSGPKGVGKSVFARMLAVKGHAADLPVLLVSDAVPGVSNFISSIHQECIVIFDEFEKVFNIETNRGDSLQTELLSLFDGLDDGKKLYVITCNDTRRLSEYLINRPGRFHYHFVVGAPSDDDIREYMMDHLQAEVQHYVDDIIAMSHSADFTYDILRAIAFELNQGYSLSEALLDLNIEEDREIRFGFKVYFKNGQCAMNSDEGDVIPLVGFGQEDVWCTFLDNDDPKKYGRVDNDIRFRFSPKAIYFEGGKYHIDPADMTISYSGNWEDNEDLEKQFKGEYIISRIELTKLPRYFGREIRKFMF